MSCTGAEGAGPQAGLRPPPAPSVKSHSLGSSRAPGGSVFCELILDSETGTCFQPLILHTLGAGRASRRLAAVMDSRRQT